MNSFAPPEKESGLIPALETLSLVAGGVTAILGIVSQIVKNKEADLKLKKGALDLKSLRKEEKEIKDNILNLKKEEEARKESLLNKPI